MSFALSVDLRRRVVAAVEEEGLTDREAGAHFKVSAASVSRWHRLAGEKRDVRRGPLGGDRNSWRVEAHRTVIQEIVDANPDISTAELRAVLGDRKGLSLGYDTLWRLLQGCGYTRKKKTHHAKEQEHPDILKRRQAWLDGQLDLKPYLSVFIDETWVSTNMVRSHGRCPRGQQLRIAIPYGH